MKKTDRRFAFVALTSLMCCAFFRSGPAQADESSAPQHRQPVRATGDGSDNQKAGSISLRHPVPAFPFFHVHCSFEPDSYKPFTIESVEVNGEPALNYRVLKSSTAGDGKAEQIRALEANDGRIPSSSGFSVDLPHRWKSTNELAVVVTGKTETDEAQRLRVGTTASWESVALDGWQHSAGIVVKETAGVARTGDPVTVTLGLVCDDVTDARKEIRVATRLPNHPDANARGFVEVPSQVLDVTVWNDPQLLNLREQDSETGERIYRYLATTTVELVFLAAVEAYEERVFLVCYGNPDAEAPLYETDLRVKGEGLQQTVSTDSYTIGLAGNSGVVETVLVRGDPDVLLEHKIETNGAVHWNPGVYCPPEPWVHASDWEDPDYETKTGPVVHRLSRYADLPSVTHTAAHVTYHFFARQPYLLSETVMEVKKDIFVQAIRNGEIVFNHAVLDEFVWKDELGKIQYMELASAKRHPIHALEIPADTPWQAFISRKQGVGFASINIDYTNINLFGRSVSEAQPYIYVQVGPWIYWSRGLVYPFGHANFTRMMPVRKGSVYCETNAYLPFRLDSGPNPFAGVEKYHKILTQPLVVTEHMPLNRKTPRQWIMPLLTAPFDEGVEGAKSARELPEK